MLYARGTLPQYSCWSIHSAEIILSHSSRHSFCCNHAVALIYHQQHSSIIVFTVLEHTPGWANESVCLRPHILALSRVHMVARPSFWVFRAPTSTPRCLTVRAAQACLRIRMLLGVTRLLCRLLLRGAGCCGYCDGCIHRLQIALSLSLPPSLPLSILPPSGSLPPCLPPSLLPPPSLPPSGSLPPSLRLSSPPSLRLPPSLPPSVFLPPSPPPLSPGPSLPPSFSLSGPLPLSLSPSLRLPPSLLPSLRLPPSLPWPSLALPACLPLCLPASLPACLHPCLPAWVAACLPAASCLPRQAKNLRTPSNILRIPSNILRTPSNILHTSPIFYVPLQVFMRKVGSTPQFTTPGGKGRADRCPQHQR